MPGVAVGSAAQRGGLPEKAGELDLRPTDLPSHLAGVVVEDFDLRLHPLHLIDKRMQRYLAAALARSDAELREWVHDEPAVFQDVGLRQHAA